jgi:hypothetical protein
MIDRVAVGREVPGIALVAARGLLEAVTDVDGAGAGEWFVARVLHRPDVAEQQRIDRQRTVGDRSDGSGEPPGRNSPLCSSRTGWRPRGRP